MANEERDETAQIKKAMSKNKKKLITTIITVTLIVVSVGGYFGVKYTATQAALKKQQEEILKSTPIKDLAIDEADKNTVYSKKIEVINSGLSIPGKNIIQFEGTIVFYNKYAEKLYDGDTNYATEVSSSGEGEGSSSSETSSFGDVKVRDTLLGFFGNANFSQISSKDAAAESAKKVINERYKKDYGQEIVKEIYATKYQIA